jgi:heme-degrading monooxygenase HmoA
MNIASLDPATAFPAQLQHETGPITLVNVFVVPPGLQDKFLEAWQQDAEFMKGRPGCISTQMHRGTAGSQLLINVAIWESTQALFAAFSTAEFQAAAARYPDGITAYPHIFEKIAVPGICVA